MNLLKISLLATVLAFAQVAPAHAILKLGVVGNLTSSHLTAASDTISISSDSKLGVGAGALLEVSTGLMTAFEVGALYHPRKIGGETASITSNYLIIPAQFRLWLVNTIVVGGGVYYGKGVGDSTGSILNETFRPTGTTPKNDFGLIASAGLDLPLAPLLSLVVEGRYLHGLVDMEISPAAATTEKWRDYQGLFGVRFGI